MPPLRSTFAVLFSTGQPSNPDKDRELRSTLRIWGTAVQSLLSDLPVGITRLSQPGREHTHSSTNHRAGACNHGPAGAKCDIASGPGYFYGPDRNSCTFVDACANYRPIPNGNVPGCGNTNPHRNSTAYTSAAAHRAGPDAAADSGSRTHSYSGARANTLANRNTAADGGARTHFYSGARTNTNTLANRNTTADCYPHAHSDSHRRALIDFTRTSRCRTGTPFRIERP